MEKIVIQVKDKDKAKMLSELLKALDFVSQVTVDSKDEVEISKTSAEGTSDFFSLAGIWSDREISLEAIRQKAWPRQHL